MNGSIMKKIALTALISVLLPSALFAQATVLNRIAWTQPDVATVADAQAMTYKYYPDGTAVGIVLQSVVCAGVPTTPASIECVAPFPAFTPGSHSLQITATNTAGEGAKSEPFSFVFMIVPSAPVNIRVR